MAKATPEGLKTEGNAPRSWIPGPFLKGDLGCAAPQPTPGPICVQGGSCNCFMESRLLEARMDPVRQVVMVAWL